jgi:DNA polymerase III delta prime subunit
MNIIKFSNELTDDFFSEVAHQLQKDIDMCGLDSSIDITSKENFLKSVFQFVQYLHHKDVKSMMNLLYRIDVKEQHIADVARKYQLSFEEAIALSIMHRELEKVKFKRAHSK